MPKQKRNWLVDAILFLGFLGTFFLDQTGVSWHQWLGIGIGALVVYHLIVHWSWVKTLTSRLFSLKSGQPRLYYLIDWVLFLDFAAIGLSGLLISTWFNLSLDNYLVWKNLHVYGSIAALAVILLKIGFHWRWIVKTAGDYFGIWKRIAPTPALVPATSSSSGAGMDRRDFLQLMGVAGIASLISAANLLELGQDTSQAIIKSRSYGSETAGDALSDPAALDCQPICDQGCVFPGKCRRYTDQNQNGICDLSECPDTLTSNESLPESDNAIANLSAEEVPAEAVPSSDSSCVALCPQGCSYPGHCPDYTDANGNNLCDYGECLASNLELQDLTTHQSGGGGGRRRRGEWE
jgi:hypothetical protein